MILDNLKAIETLFSMIERILSEDPEITQEVEERICYRLREIRIFILSEAYPIGPLDPVLPKAGSFSNNRQEIPGTQEK